MPTKIDNPGGFGAIAFADGGPNPVAAAPEGALFVRQRLFPPDLGPGADVTGSFILTVDVTSVDGLFEIDSTCTNPANHLYFADPANQLIVPSFTPGIITIGNPNDAPVAICQNVIVDADQDCGSHAAATDFDGGSWDPNGDPLTFAAEPPGPYSLGVTPIRLIVTDDSGDSDTCDATLTVEDNMSPSIACPPNLAFEPDAVGDFGTATATDVCDPSPTVTVVVRDSIPATDPEEYTLILTWEAADYSGNTDQCQQVITVRPPCHDRLSDVDCDGFTTALDLSMIIDILFAGADEAPSCTEDPVQAARVSAAIERGLGTVEP
jgi:hypothetical protein